MSTFKTLSTVKCFGGVLHRVSHTSACTKSGMTFAVFLPPQAETSKVPALYYLSGLTCTDENFTQKAGAQRAAVEHGIALIAPDTSPRGDDKFPEYDFSKGAGFDNTGWDFGTGAGFYVNATQEPWSANFQMYDYITKELPQVVGENFQSVDVSNVSITGHSMGGHGALTIALKNPGVFKSASAFAPICNPVACPWGEKAFTGYLGGDKAAWAEHDATELVASYEGPDLHLLVDQGDADNFYTQKQLLPENLKAACEAKGISLTLNMQPGYDHSYFFIASFIGEHIAHHASFLKA